MSGYTPGPWVEQDGFIFAEWAHEPVAEMPPYEGTESDEFFARMDANVRLICAAPELLAALERTLNWLASYKGGGTMNAGGPYEQACAAINKATGTSSVDSTDRRGA